MQTTKKIFKDWIIPFGIEIIVVLLILKFAFFFVNVPTGSMVPTIAENGWLFTTRMYSPQTTVKRGDIVVFESDELGELMIKRVIGLPGDEVVVEPNVTYINGEPLEEDYVKHPGNVVGQWQVPQGCYLFFGDNRANSFDARLWNNPYIPADKLVGEARFSLWPPSNFGLLS